MATSAADTSLLLQQGAVIKSAAVDPQGRIGLKEMIFDKLIGELVAVMDGSGLVLDGPRVGATEHALADLKMPIVGPNGGRVVAGNELGKLFNLPSAVKFASDADLPTDGATDATAALNSFFLSGASTLLVNIPAGVVIAGPVYLQSGNTLAFSPGTKVKLGPAGCFRLHGDYRQNYAAAPLQPSGTVSPGATTINLNTTPAGSGVASDFFSVGDRFLIREGANSHESRVTALGTLSITFADACPVGFTTAARITRQVLLHVDSDVAADAKVIPVRPADLTRVSLNDYVMAIDDRDAGSASVPAVVEMAKIVGIQSDGANTVTLDRPLRRGLLAASNARLHVLDPIVGAVLSGPNIAFTGSPGASRVDVCQIAYAVECVVEHPRIVNEDTYGTRGQMFRCYRSYRSGYRDVVGLRPKYRNAGEGHGFVCIESTQCFLEGAILEGCNNSITYQASTDCWHDLVSSVNPQGQHVVWQGAWESGCWGRLMWTEGGANLAAFGGANTRGAHDCYLELVKSRNPSGAHVEVVAPSSRCGVRAFQLYGGTNAVHATDHPTDSSMIGDDNYLELGQVYGVTADWAALVDGGTFNTSARGMRRLRLDDVDFFGCDKHFWLRRCTDPIIAGCEIVAPAAQTDTWALRANQASGLEVVATTLRRIPNAWNLTSCPSARIHRCSYVDLTGGAEYADGGGNAGAIGAGNVALGFTLTGELPATSTRVTGTAAAAGSVDGLAFHIETVANKTYFLAAKMPFAGTINSLERQVMTSGSCTLKVQINGVDVTGLTALSATTSDQSSNASGANVFAAGDRVTMVASGNSAALDLVGELKFTKS